MNDLEKLLQQKEESIKYVLYHDEIKKDKCKIPHGGTAKKMQRADKNASLYDFLDMIANVVEYSLSDWNVKFSTDEELNVLKDPEVVVDRPHITYRVISRKPKSDREYKPIVREEVVECDENGEQRPGAIYGQFFDCILQFNVFAGESRTANIIMEKFEELMLSHAGYFKQKGVSDFYFREQLTDSEYNNFRETLSVRNIRYYVQIEKISVIFNRKVNYIDMVGDTIDIK